MQFGYPVSYAYYDRRACWNRIQLHADTHGNRALDYRSKVQVSVTSLPVAFFAQMVAASAAARPSLSVAVPSETEAMPMRPFPPASKGTILLHTSTGTFVTATVNCRVAPVTVNVSPNTLVIVSKSPLLSESCSMLAGMALDVMNNVVSAEVPKLDCDWKIALTWDCRDAVTRTESVVFAEVEA